MVKCKYSTLEIAKKARKNTKIFKHPVKKVYNVLNNKRKYELFKVYCKTNLYFYLNF